jgi:hypothetical protein
MSTTNPDEQDPDDQDPDDQDHRAVDAPAPSDHAVSAPLPYVVDTADNLPSAAIFTADRDQVVLAVRITPVYGQVDLELLMKVVDVANQNDFGLVREQLFRDEWLLCVFEAYEDD